MRNTIEGLVRVYRSWSSIKDNDIRKKKINQVLPFIQLCNCLNAVLQIKKDEQNITEDEGEFLEFTQSILDNFNVIYQLIYREEFEKELGKQGFEELMDTQELPNLLDLSKLHVSDFPADMMLKLSEVTEDNVDDGLRDRIILRKDKYEHAHSKVMFNYGSFWLKIFESYELGSDERKSIIDAINDPNISLVELGKIFNISGNAAILGLDDLETHALLNQLTNHKLNLERAVIVLGELDSIDRLVEFFESDQVSSLETHAGLDDREISRVKLDRYVLEGKECEINIGFECEFLLRDLNDEFSKNTAIKTALADLAARRKKEVQYLGEEAAKIADIDDHSIFEREEVSKDEILDINRVRRDLRDYVGEALDSKTLLAINNLRREELFFYKILFLSDEMAETPLEMDGVITRNDDGTINRDETKKTVLELIRKGVFYDKILDMIRAHEIALGPYDDLAVGIKELEEVIQHFKLEANRTGLSLENPNVQLNFSFYFQGQNVFFPEIVGARGKEMMQVSGLTREIVKVMQTVMSELSSTEDILRDQTEISSVYDKVKLLPELAGTSYRLEDDCGLAAFDMHRQNAGKTGTIRLSRVSETDGVAEIRIIGNNPHFACFKDGVNIFEGNSMYLTETIVPKIQRKITEFISSKTVEELQALFDEKVVVEYDGSISGVTPVRVETPVQWTRPASDVQEVHDPVASLRSIGHREV